MNTTPAIIFYDGQCALCHGFVKYVLRNDKRAEFLFSPLQGETMKKLIPADRIKALPDSVVVRAFAGELFLKSDAVIYVLSRLGPISKTYAKFFSITPQVIRNFFLDQKALLIALLNERPALSNRDLRHALSGCFVQTMFLQSWGARGPTN